MTPAQIQQIVYTGVVHANTYLAPTVGMLVRDLQGKLPVDCGWSICSCIGTNQPPPGAVLLGAVVSFDPDEEDHNLYAYPASATAMLLKGKAITIPGDMPLAPARS